MPKVERRVLPGCGVSVDVRCPTITEQNASSSDELFSVPRYNYQAQFQPSFDGLLRDLGAMLLGGDYVLSPQVAKFESEFARFNESAFCLGVNSGTDALLIALRSLGIGPGDEVITQANTFYATAAAIELTGAKPVLVDADEASFLMDVQALRAAITRRTRVAIPVHLYGKPTPMAEILALAHEKGFMVVEDAAQAHGARVHGRRVGTFGAAGCFSFHPSKNLAAAGDAGAIVTDDATIARRVEQIRALGQQEPNDHVAVGYNSKLDSLQARILSHKLDRLDRWNAERRGVARLYRETLRDVPVSFQREDPDEEHVYHLFQIRSARRDDLRAHLKRNGVDAVVRHPVPIHLQPAFRHHGWTAGQFPVAERLAKELLCLPIRPDLTDDDVAFVSGCVRSFFEGARAGAGT
jgi:dTDP-4-amino-4,6-dideoxygalactose transaminase